MRLLPRDSDFGTIASALSLAAANYKPIPQLPTSSSAAPLHAIATDDGRSEATLDRGYSFKVQPNNATDSYASTHSVADWGEPSTLYVPVTANGTIKGHKFASGRRVGPGQCPYAANEYVPQGGWDNLPPPRFPPFDPVKATIMRYRQQQGANLGTWFVQEGWMESEFMSCATGSKQAEFDILDGFGYSGDGLKSARAYMEEHWDTFFTEQDFRKMAEMGVNTVRLPIGYWSVGPYFCHSSPFENYRSVYEFSWRYIARAINWAAKYDIGVIVDLHGAYGSQNGQAHSGLADGNMQWYNSYNQDLTTELLVWLAKEISDVTNVIGIQLLNEPQNRDSYWQWLPNAMQQMRDSSPYAATVPLYFHDAFVLDKGANYVAGRSDFVVSDHHSYYVYTDSDQSLTAQGHISKLDGQITGEFERASATARRNLIVGEWSCALASSSLKNVKSQAKRDSLQREFCEAQRSVWETTTAGWQFWSHRLQNCQENPGWCFEASVGRYLPSDFNVWGQDLTPFPYDSDADKAAVKDSALMLAINAIRPPSNATGKASAAKSLKQQDPRIGKVMLADVQLEDDGNDEDQAAALLAMTRMNPVHNNAPVNTIDPEALTRRGGATTQASLWARNQRHGAGLFARAASQSPEERGYKDGFYTTKIFAAQGLLSRLGFTEQYRQDTWQTYIKAGVYQKQDEGRYKEQFLLGAKQGEEAVSKAVAEKGKMGYAPVAKPAQGGSKDGQTSTNGTSIAAVASATSMSSLPSSTPAAAAASTSQPASSSSSASSSNASPSATASSQAQSAASAASSTSSKPAASAISSSSSQPSPAAAAATSSAATPKADAASTTPSSSSSSPAAQQTASTQSAAAAESPKPSSSASPAAASASAAPQPSSAAASSSAAAPASTTKTPVAAAAAAVSSSSAPAPASSALPAAASASSASAGSSSSASSAAAASPSSNSSAASPTASASAANVAAVSSAATSSSTSSAAPAAAIPSSVAAAAAASFKAWREKLENAAETAWTKDE